MTKVLVTGSDGFIGSHLVEQLVREGYEVRAFVLYNSFGNWGWLDRCAKDIKGNFEVFLGDIRDPNGVYEAMQGCDFVINLAALIAIPYSYHSPDSYIDVNVKGALNVLQAARKLGIERIIHTSTSEVYGTAKYVPIDEKHPLQGQSPYSASKIAADQLAYSFFASFDLPVVILRPFNTYGPRQSARAVIPTIITQIANGISRIKLGATSPTRDFNYVKDTVSGFVAALKSTKGVGEVVNIGSNYEISIGETSAVIAKLMNADIEIECDDIRIRPAASEVERLWADNYKAKDLFLWSPSYSGKEGFQRGLIQTIEWFQNPENLTQYKSFQYNV